MFSISSRRAVAGFSALLAAGLLVTVTTTGAQQEPNEELIAARQIMASQDKDEILTLLTEYLKNYPESGYLLRGVLEQGIKTAAVSYPDSSILSDFARHYIRLYPSTAIGYNNVAWYLYEVDSALDRAAVWADSALALAEGDTPANRAMILDTVSHIAFARGDVTTAVARQREAVELIPDAPDVANYMTELGIFLVEAREWEEATDYLVEALLLNANNPDAVEAFGKLPGDREQAVMRGVDRMLSTSDDPGATKAVLAVNLAKMGVALERAKEFATEAVEQVGPEKGPAEYLQARLAMAQVHVATGEFGEALGLLDPLQRIASPYNFDFFVTRANALAGLGRKEEAIEALMDGAVIYPVPPVMEPLQELWNEVYGEEKDMREVLVSMAGELSDWHPEGTFTPPENLPGRVVLAELFTGSECPPCVASDMAFDGLIAYYPREVSAILVYHEHIPGPDPMTGPDSVTRLEYYNSEERVVGGTPTVLVDGVAIPGGGGGASVAKAKFGEYGWVIEQAMMEAPGVSIELSGNRDDRDISVSATVRVEDRDLLESADLRLRVALAEKLVHFEGSNRVSEHAMVVRSFIGGHDGLPIQRRRVNFSAGENIGELEAGLLEYLTTFEQENQRRFRGQPGFTEKKHEIDETGLVLVAFVQDDNTKKILQAVYTELK